MINDFLFVLNIFIWILVSSQYLLYLLNFFQQHEYNNKRFFYWSIRNINKIGRYQELIILPFLVLQIYFLSHHLNKFWLFFAQCFFLGSQIMSSFFIIQRKKLLVKKLIFTSRVKRLITASVLNTLILIILATYEYDCGFVLYWFQCLGDSTYFLVTLLLLGQILFIVLILANILLVPVDFIIRYFYIQKARKKLNTIKPIVIGITGSFGKTSTKYILTRLLEEKFEVLCTPKSYNTLMGICKVINDELTPKHQYFIVEMGTYKKGEIKNICQLVNPTIGILTAIGPQHLERFITLENIAKAKYELIEALPKNGIAIFNNDNLYCRQLANRTSVKTLRYGLEDCEKLDIKAGNIQIDLLGTKFDVTYSSELACSARMQLLGRQNVSNALGAILTALECGITLNHAIRTMVIIPPFEHRMQLVQFAAGVNLIDNAYSSNPESAMFSFEVLNAIGVSGRKILHYAGFCRIR